MRVEVNFNAIKEYAANFKRIVRDNEAQKFVEEFLTEVAYLVVSQAVYRTPVDTGALRAAWQIGDLSVVDKSGSMVDLSLNDLVSQITTVGNSLEIEILNGMEYANFVEYGHRTRAGGWVNGRYMITVPLDEMEREITELYEIAIQRWAKKQGLV